MILRVPKGAAGRDFREVTVEHSQYASMLFQECIHRGAQLWDLRFLGEWLRDDVRELPGVRPAGAGRTFNAEGVPRRRFVLGTFSWF